jgi:hypothetical protein
MNNHEDSTFSSKMQKSLNYSTFSSMNKQDDTNYQKMRTIKKII